LFGIGVFEEHDLDLGAVARLLDAVGPDPAPPPCAPPGAPPVPIRPCSAVAMSRALAFLSATTRVDEVSVSTRRMTSRMRRILSAKSTTTRLLPPRFAVTDPCALTSGRTVSTALAASVARRRMISVT
jgi:hypothetical protein